MVIISLYNGLIRKLSDVMLKVCLAYTDKPA